MIEIRKSGDNGLVEQDVASVEKGAWVSLVAPSREEIERVQLLSGAPLDFLQAALDTEEPSRMEVSKECLLVLVNIPVNYESEADSYNTLPLAIVVTPDMVVTVCVEDNRILQSFSVEHAAAFDTRDRARFIFQLLYRSASLFLKDLRQMNRRAEQMEQGLRASMRNKGLFALLDLQKGLTFYSISLHSNRVVIDRMLRFTKDEEHAHAVKLHGSAIDLLEDVCVEYDQAIEMAQIQTEVLSGMTDTFASVISNNLNVVMKFLASVTIVMSIPTIVSGFFGMNVAIPWGGHPLGFWIILVMTLGLAGAAIWVLWKKDLF